ncbi:DeoR/GlpR family DNA-binding transcription regulator [Alkalihalobacillus sp. BA299]|uniref:DeoR/GlpR family DNA-binding transcription regulator n=1 Tax=Alkalihalobacillus sp. BA299 TaxID=2815938 RepID=UPI001ADC355F|nr:DeoR/GlpR family DNA-binding transcription regulator [Alkalihalobacillus sp. BA299]
MSQKAYERRKNILNQIEAYGNLKVEDLLKQYSVSAETIRRDLRILESEGLLKKTYGGAAVLEKTTRYTPYQERLNINSLEKQAIGEAGSRLLEEGDSVFIEGKTTCLALSKLIPPHMELTVVTNSIYVAYNLARENSKIKVFLAGGQLNTDGMTYGPKLYQELKGYRFDKAFISSVSVNSLGCYFSKPEPMQLAQTLPALTSELILLSDSSKVGKSAFLLGIPISQIQYLITDEGSPIDVLQKIKDTGCKVIVAPLENQKAQ